MLPKFNFFAKNQSGFEEGELVSSDEVGAKKTQKLQSDSKPLHLFPSQNQKNQKYEFHEKVIGTTRCSKYEMRANENSKRSQQSAGNGFEVKNPQMTQRQLKKNNSFQMQNQNRGDGYHGMYGDDRNEMYNSLKSGQYKKVNGGIGNREPFMKSSDIYSTYFQYPFNYDMYRPHPIAPPSEKRAQNKIRQQSKQNVQIKQNREKQNIKERERIEIEEENEGQMEAIRKERGMDGVKTKIQQILNNFDYFDRQLLLQIFEDILSHRVSGSEDLWNFIDKFKGKSKEEKGQLIFDILDILELDKVMYEMRDIQERQKQQRLQKGSKIKRLLYSLAVPINPI